jgi:hypothetical protein
MGRRGGGRRGDEGGAWVKFSLDLLRPNLRVKEARVVHDMGLRRRKCMSGPAQ